MSPAPRRYRAALRLCPAAYRRELGSDVLATVQDGDDERGRPSTREALALAGHGAGLRLTPGHATGLLGALGLLALAAALAPDGWWAHHATALSPTDAAFGPQPPILRLLLLAVGLVAVLRAAPRPALALAGATPYALLVSGDLQMGYGLGALGLQRTEVLPLAGASIAALAGAVLAGRAVRRLRAPDAAIAVATALGGASAAAVLSTLESVGGAGSGGPGVPLGPSVAGGVGLASVACLVVAALSAVLVLRALPRRTTSAA